VVGLEEIAQLGLVGEVVELRTSPAQLQRLDARAEQPGDVLRIAPRQR
jgi:hypothetical protein